MDSVYLAIHGLPPSRYKTAFVSATKLFPFIANFLQNRRNVRVYAD